MAPNKRPAKRAANRAANRPNSRTTPSKQPTKLGARASKSVFEQSNIKNGKLQRHTDNHANNKAVCEPVICEPMRVAKAIARAGLCSRREAERWIKAGRVRLNGKLLLTPAQTVSPGDELYVDDVLLPATLTIRLWRYHKPRGRLTTRSDPQGRPTIFDDLPSELANVITIGRLDYNTEGLLLLTNHGGLARHLELPATAVKRRYRVRAHGHITQQALDELAQGITIDGTHFAPAQATLERQVGQNCWLNITLTEGKNHEVKRLLGTLGLTVNRLIRTHYGPIELGALEAGKTAEIALSALGRLSPFEPRGKLR